MIDPTPDHIRQLREVTGSDPLLLTIAPERTGAIETIGLAVSLGITVSLGHTDASAAIIQNAVAAGARAFTHLGNGCTAQLDRRDNILWRVLDQRGLTVSLIPDKIHLTPALFRVLHRALAPERICYITDAMAAAGARPGTFTLGDKQLCVGEDGIVREPGSPYLSGSALTPIEGVRRAAAMLGESWQSVWRRFSEIPAKLMGQPDEWLVISDRGTIST